jgi:predicted O-linked N-acetylglucosamine transferase (SPINDLY family)
MEKLQEAFGRFNDGDIAAAERLCTEVLRRVPANTDALHLLGVIRMMSGAASAAIPLLITASAAKPRDAAILENLGLAHLMAQEYARAEAALVRAMTLGAAHGRLYMRLGLAIGSQGRLGEAIGMLRTAVAKSPQDPDTHLNLGNALFEAGQADAAVDSFRRVLALQPDHIDAHFNLGTVFMRNNRHEEAAAAFRHVLDLAPDYADAHVNLGLVFAEQGRIEESTASYRRALELNPEHVQALNNLGNLFLLQERREEAIASYERARSVRPDHPDAYINLGNVSILQGEFQAARHWYETLLAISPDSPDANRTLGRFERAQGRPREALAFLRRAAELDPNGAESCADLAAAYRESAAYVDASAWYRKAIALDPRHVRSHYELAENLKMLGFYDEAIASYEQALAIKPDHFAALGGLIYMRQINCNWDGIDGLWEQRRNAIAAGSGAITPFSILSQPTSPQEQLACATAWSEQEFSVHTSYRPRTGFDFSSRRQRPERLRIGYFSWDFQQHATSYLIAELFELHDRNRFEISAYSYGPDDGSAMRARIRAGSDRFVDLISHSHIDAARAIYRDGIDILVDLKGYTMGARPQVMALRPAPVQMNWLGYPGTMGNDCIDYIVADPYVIPHGAEAFYREKVIRLPDCYQINDRRRPISSGTMVREEHGLPVQGMVFCCFNQSNKILPDVFSCWMRILNAVPDSVLWLLEANRWAAENLKREAAVRGIAPERLIFAPVAPLADHLARYRIADLALDTYPYTSHTTGSDALWAGCPLVTLSGSTFAARVAGSLLYNAGLPELITESLDAYEVLILDLARNRARLDELRGRLQSNRDSCALFDAPRFVRHLEQAFDLAWSEHVTEHR